MGIFDSALACFEEGSLLDRAGQESHLWLLRLLETRDSSISGLKEKVPCAACALASSLLLG